MSYAAPPLQLSIILADPAGGERLHAMIAALRDARLGLALEVIGVIGGEGTGLARLQRDYPLITWLHEPGGAEQGALLNRAAAAARGRYLLLLDGRAVPDRASIEGMIQFMEKGQWVGALGPRLVTPSGQDVPSARSFPTVASTLAESRGARAAACAPRIANAIDRQVTAPKEVDAVAGGCCMIKRQAFVEVGPWDTGYAEGGEMLDWCRRVRLKGWSAFYHPGLVARLVDEEPSDPRAVAARTRSACRFIARHHGLGELGMLKLLLAGASLRALLLEGSAALIPGGHRERARGAFARAWWVMGALWTPRRSRPA